MPFFIKYCNMYIFPVKTNTYSTTFRRKNNGINLGAKYTDSKI